MTQPARTAAATLLRNRMSGQPDEARMAAAAKIEAGEDDGWLVRHAELKMEAERG